MKIKKDRKIQSRGVRLERAQHVVATFIFYPFNFELFSVKELSPWLVHANGTLFHKTLQTLQTEMLLNEILGHIILN